MLRLTQNIGFIFLIFIGFSCNKPAQIDPVLVEIDSILEIQPDSALILLEKMNPPTDFNNYNRSYYYIQLTKARSNNGQSLLPSDSLIDWAIAHLDDEKDKLLKARAYLLKGKIWTELEENEEAILIYQKALDLIENKEEENYYEILSKIYDDLGRIYENENLYREALETYRKTLALDRKMQNNRYISLSLSNIGYTYFYLNKPDSAFYYFQQALEVAQQSTDSVNLKNRIYHYLGVYYREIKEYEKALKQYQKIADTKNKAYFLSKGHTFMNLQEYDSARHYLHLSTQSENIYTRASGYLYLSELEKSLYNYKEAHAYAVAYQNLSDSIYEIKTTTEIRTLNHKYDTQTAINQLEAEHKMRYQIISFIFLIIVFTIILSRIIVHKREKIKQKELEMKLIHQANQILQKEKEILLKEQEIQELNQSIEKTQKNLSKYENSHYQIEAYQTEIKAKKENLAFLLYQLYELQCDNFKMTASYKRIQQLESQNKNGDIGIFTYEEQDILEKDIFSVFKEFIKDLNKKCPSLTKNDVVLCCLSLLHLPTFVIASCCGFPKTNTIRQRKYAIKKKMVEESDNEVLFNLIFPSQDTFL